LRKSFSRVWPSPSLSAGGEEDKEAEREGGGEGRREAGAAGVEPRRVVTKGGREELGREAWLLERVRSDGKNDRAAR